MGRGGRLVAECLQRTYFAVSAKDAGRCRPEAFPRPIWASQEFCREPSWGLSAVRLEGGNFGMDLGPDSSCGYRHALMHRAASLKLGWLGSIGLLHLRDNLHVPRGKSTSTVISYRRTEEVFSRRIFSIQKSFDPTFEKLSQNGGILDG